MPEIGASVFLFFPFFPSSFFRVPLSLFVFFSSDFSLGWCFVLHTYVYDDVTYANDDVTYVFFHLTFHWVGVLSLPWCETSLCVCLFWSKAVTSYVHMCMMM